MTVLPGRFARWFPWLIAASLYWGLPAPVNAEQNVEKSFSQIERVKSDLHKGVSTKQDALFLLGEPNGSGGALIPTTSGVRDIWFYEDVTSSGVISQRVNQKVLLIFFVGDVYDGHLWFINDTDLKLK